MLFGGIRERMVVGRALAAFRRYEAARERYRYRVEHDFWRDLEVPAFLRQTSAERRSRYVRMRPRGSGF